MFILGAVEVLQYWQEAQPLLIWHLPLFTPVPSEHHLALESQETISSTPAPHSRQILLQLNARPIWGQHIVQHLL